MSTEKKILYEISILHICNIDVVYMHAKNNLTKSGANKQKETLDISLCKHGHWNWTSETSVFHISKHVHFDSNSFQRSDLFVGSLVKYVHGDQDHFLCKEMLISGSILKLHKNPWIWEGLRTIHFI